MSVLEEEIAEMRSRVVSVQSGANDEYRNRLDSLEVQLKAVNFESSNKYELERTKLKSFVKDFANKMKTDFSSLESKVKTVEEMASRLSKTTSDRLCDNLETIEELQYSMREM